jgi:hypothetical protein
LRRIHRRPSNIDEEVSPIMLERHRSTARSQSATEFSGTDLTARDHQWLFVPK